MHIATPFKHHKQFLQLHLKIIHGSLCDTFLDLLPLVVIMASITLTVVITNIVIPSQTWAWLQQMLVIHNFLEKIFPLMVCMAIASYFADTHSVPVTHAIVASIVTFIFVQVFMHQGFSFEFGSWVSLYNINIILSPLVVVLCLRFILTPFGLDERTVSLDSSTLIAISSLLPMLLGVTAASLVLIVTTDAIMTH